MSTPIRPDSPDAPANRHETPQGSSSFQPTRWSVVLKASGAAGTAAGDALERLCQTYWYPLYVYVRRRGYSPADAQDLTQEFFARLLKTDWLRRADQQKGKFRSFLLSAMNHFLADEWDRARALKRGGGIVPLPLQLDTAETRYGHEPADLATPEQNFERRWALALLEQVLNRLRKEFEGKGRAELFELLHPCLIGPRASLPYAELAANLGLTESAVKTAVHRLRQRYRELLLEEIAHTVSQPGEVREELNHLFTVLAGR